MLSRCFLDFVGVGVFVIGLIQISSFPFSLNLNVEMCKFV